MPKNKMKKPSKEVLSDSLVSIFYAVVRTNMIVFGVEQTAKQFNNVFNSFKPFQL